MSVQKLSQKGMEGGLKKSPNPEKPLENTFKEV